MLYLIILGWLLCGILGHGLYFGYFQGEFPMSAEDEYRDDMVTSLLLSLTSPIALVAILIFLPWDGTFKHGLKFW